MCDLIKKTLDGLVVHMKPNFFWNRFSEAERARFMQIAEGIVFAQLKHDRNSDKIFNLPFPGYSGFNAWFTHKSHIRNSLVFPTFLNYIKPIWPRICELKLETKAENMPPKGVEKLKSYRAALGLDVDPNAPRDNKDYPANLKEQVHNSIILRILTFLDGFGFGFLGYWMFWF